ncbi:MULTISPECIES: hypothetical protein [unclassified Paenibacillus]|uniref:hypothetical protein n=1 Tax=unclassified Paenibacillus TaxID=185978 RepID=UPI000894D195|nr:MULTISPECIES: hypothetical protein [unclassified Paenibacillus]OMC68645.1 hypothetical protein BK126_12515 [Paenibacillus sp. FSL H7-0326]SDW56316.1 hypothetical protein SAMN05518848_102190 [Paenibacillus sp. PDC88]
MAFNIVYVAGGVIDKVRELPYPHFSKKTIPFIRGQMLDIPAAQTTKSDTFTLPYDTEFLSIAFAASQYCVGDYWELTIGNEKVCQTIFTKELPESVSMGNSFGIVYPIAAGTQIKFDFVNVVPEAKSVWYNIKFLR